MTVKDVGHTKIRSLQCYNQMIALAQTGATWGECARFIQERGEMKKIQLRSVEQAVRRYFEENPGLAVTKDPALARAIDLKHGGDLPGYIIKLRDKVEDHIDVLTEMERLYGLQRERVLEYRDQEQKGKEVGASLRAEIKVAIRMLGDIAKLQMDLEIIEKAPTRIDARVAQWKQLDIGTQLLELVKDRPEMAKLLESPEAIKEMLRGELIED